MESPTQQNLDAYLIYWSHLLIIIFWIKHLVSNFPQEIITIITKMQFKKKKRLPCFSVSIPVFWNISFKFILSCVQMILIPEPWQNVWNRCWEKNNIKQILLPSWYLRKKNGFVSVQNVCIHKKIFLKPSMPVFTFPLAFAFLHISAP